MFSPRIAAVAALALLGGLVGAVGAAPEQASSTAAQAQPLPSGAVVQRAPEAVNVKAENALAGSTGWRISAARGQAPGISAYAKAVSVRPGASVPLVVSAAGAVSVRALRIGWYAGDRARQVWRGTVQAHVQAGAPETWQPNGWADTTGWPEGHYLLRLDGVGQAAAASRFIPLTIRSASAQGKILILTSPLTWQSTNPIRDGAATPGPAGTSTGGTGTGSGGSAGAAPSASTSASGTSASGTSASGTSASGTSATAVVRGGLSFDRPYVRGAGGGGFLTDDAGVVEYAERTGRNLAYATDYDLATDPALAAGAAAIVTGSDSRFWTSAGRTALASAASDGTNLAFFGAGTASRTVRLDGRALSVSKGVSSSVRLTGQRPSCTTVTAAPATTAWTVGDAQWWGYRGTGVRKGSTLADLVGGRADHAAFAVSGSPKAVQVLAYGTLTCGGAYSVQSAAYFTKSSGAAVFSAGTARWGCALTGTCVAPAVTRVAAKVTQNVVNMFATAKTGRRHPATDTTAQYPNLS